MFVGAPFVEAEQDGPIRIEDLSKVIMGRKRSRLTEQRLVPFEAARDVAYPYDRPRVPHRSPIQPNSCLDRPRSRHGTPKTILRRRADDQLSLFASSICP